MRPCPLLSDTRHRGIFDEADLPFTPKSGAMDAWAAVRLSPAANPCADYGVDVPQLFNVSTMASKSVDIGAERDQALPFDPER